jgi:hypothetical protein
MDHLAVIKQVYEHLQHDQVDKAVMGCLRLARNLQDYLYAAIFLREMSGSKREFWRAIYYDIAHLKKEAQEFILKRSLDYWADNHTLPFAIGTNEHGEERNVFAISVGEVDSEIEQCERSIQDLALPSGLGPFDAAAFMDRYNNTKAQMRLRIRGAHCVKQRIGAMCLNYATRVEHQLEAEAKSQTFLERVQREVDNFFKAHCEDVYSMLQKAAQLMNANDLESHSLLLTEVRRAIKGAADYFQPATNQAVQSRNDTERVFTDAQYLNRLEQYLKNLCQSSTANDLLRADFDHLLIFARKLDRMASKGVHARVSPAEAKQGLVGLYMFLYNVIARLQEK